MEGLELLDKRRVNIPRDRRVALYRGMHLKSESEAKRLFVEGILAKELEICYNHFDEILLQDGKFYFNGHCYTPQEALINVWEGRQPNLGVSSSASVEIAKGVGNYVFEIVVNKRRVNNVKANFTDSGAASNPQLRFRFSPSFQDVFKVPEEYGDFSYEMEYTFY